MGNNKKGKHKQTTSVQPPVAATIARKGQSPTSAVSGTAPATQASSSPPPGREIPPSTTVGRMASGEGDKPTTGTMQQRRARFALKQVNELTKRLEAKQQKEFNSYASAMPFMIHANGLGQTAAFYRRKGTGDTYYQLYQLLGDWLSQPGQPFEGQADLLEGITRAEMGHYMVAQAEAMLFLDWVKKFANAFMAGESQEETS